MRCKNCRKGNPRLFSNEGVFCDLQCYRQWNLREKNVQCRDCPESTIFLSHESDRHATRKKLCMKLDKLVKPFVTHNCEHHPRKRQYIPRYTELTNISAKEDRR